jgi:hypothetical protein
MVGAQPRTSCRRLFKKFRDFDSPKPMHILIDGLLYWESGKLSDKFVSA